MMEYVGTVTVLGRQKVITITQLENGSWRVVIDLIGEGEFRLNDWFVFTDEPFATKDSAGKTVLCRMSGNANMTDLQAEGSYSVSRDGVAIASGVFIASRKQD